MTERVAGQLPTADRLLAVRTPMEIEFAPCGSRFAFSLHAVVSEHGVTQPSDLWIAEGDADPVRLTDGPWADTHPLWAPDGSRLACISDRALAGHHLPYTMVPGEEPTLAATFPGSAEQLVWSQDGQRLLVVAADPGSYSREVSGTFVTGGASELERGIRRSSGAWRRLLMVDLTTGDVAEVGPPGWSVWEVGWGRGALRRDRAYRHGMRARRLSARGPRAGRARAFARRTPANPSLVRPPSHDRGAATWHPVKVNLVRPATGYGEGTGAAESAAMVCSAH
jgi:dipeptidyl aminopeptidase/acylaminoacyl peptidase